MNKTIKIDIESKEYPALLKTIKNPPKVLYCRGNIDLLRKRSVAVVGSRRATDYGKWCTEKLTERLVQNKIAVTSGMATGIDSYAHKSVLDFDGETIAVLANGVDVCYPKSNERLYKRILERGLIISETEDGIMPQRHSFPQRNRIISGISELTVVVEAGIKSGSIITAEWAIEQGREVYAVPGNLNRNTSFGCNKLISDGAYIMVSFDDVLRELGVSFAGSRHERSDISEQEKNILIELDEHGETTIDTLCMKTGSAASRIAGIITVLEMKGYVRTAYGKIFIEN